jgi:gamma-glutamyltranspeptidase/glutathione hydrolase
VPPSSGATTLLGELKMLERFDLKALGPSSPQAVHLIAEATSLAFADREVYLADPAFFDVPVAGLTDPAYLRGRGQHIDPDKAGPPATPGTPPGLVESALAPSQTPYLPSTSHWAVVDKAGNAATFTGSIQSGFGSFIMVDGYLLNNELTDFSMRPEADGRPIVNRAEAGKRPRSSMSPTLVFDDQGRLVLALGSAGGSRIIGHVLKTVVGVLDWGLDVQQAISLPNLHGDNPRIEVEAGTPLEALSPALEAMGHTVVTRANISGLTGIQVVHDADGAAHYLGGVDPRREGIASGD